ncbi:MAG: hypothetical protein ABH874_03275 [Methanobacteriota archaeon]
MVIKCVRDSLVSRAEVLDTISGEVIGYGLDAIPSKSQALESIKCPSECDY